MIWHNWNDFFAMGGYGLYVWGSVAVVFAVIVGEVLELVWRRQAIRSELAHQARVARESSP